MSRPLITVELNTAELDALLDRIQKGTEDMTPLMVSIRQELLYQTEANFEAGGRPAWPELSEATKKARTKQNKWPGQILQVSGALARSIVGAADATSAMVGVGNEIPYAAIHQLGGQAGRNRRVPIKARPYLPLIDGQIQPEAEAAILELARAYLESLVGP